MGIGGFRRSLREEPPRQERLFQHLAYRVFRRTELSVCKDNFFFMHKFYSLISSEF